MTTTTANPNYTRGFNNGLKRKQVTKTYTQIRELYGRQYANGWRAGVAQSRLVTA